MNRFLYVTAFVLMAGCKSCGGGPPVEPLPVPVPVKPAPVAEKPVPQSGLSFKRVHFKFDSTEPTTATATVTRENVGIMQEYPDMRVEVQGHADERGTTEYNLALGERRAYAVRDAMTRMGVAAPRLTVVSYGEERPIAKGATEEVYEQNRRAEFRVLTGEPVKGTLP